MRINPETVDRIFDRILENLQANNGNELEKEAVKNALKKELEAHRIREAIAFIESYILTVGILYDFNTYALAEACMAKWTNMGETEGMSEKGFEDWGMVDFTNLDEEL